MAALAIEHDQLKNAHQLTAYNMDYHKSYQHLLHLSGHPNMNDPAAGPQQHHQQQQHSPPGGATASANGRDNSPNLAPPDNGDSKV